MSRRLSVCAILATVAGAATSINADDRRKETASEPRADAEIVRSLDEARAAIRTGRLSPLLSPLANVADETINGAPVSPLRLSTSTARVAPTVGNPNPWAASIDANDLHEGFEDPSYTAHVSLSAIANWRPISGQASTIGSAWDSSWDFVGIVDNAIAQTGPSYSGVAPDPLGEHSLFLAEPRGSIFPLTSDAYNAGFAWVARTNHSFYLPLANEPVVTIMDFYKDDLDTRTWFRPLSNTEGFIISNIFLGGYDFASLVAFTDPISNLLERPVVLGDGAFYAALSHHIKTREWFSVALRQTVDSASIWMRDSETIGTYGFTDSSSNLYPGDVSNIAGDGNVPFAGEIFESGWVQIYPGLNDDPATMSVIEGSGLAVQTDLVTTPAVMNDSSNSPAGAPLFALGIDALQMAGGFDPSPFEVVGYTPSDTYFDNYTVMGEPFCEHDISPDSPRRIDGADLAGMLAAWGTDDPLADITGDGLVDGADLAELLALWGATCDNTNNWLVP